jgi:putative FmdB family regulatory protein
MPLYDYQCEECGSFTAIRKMSESDLEMECPGCGTSSARVITAPQLAILGKAQRSAYERNEKSAHEPKIARRSSCGCNGTHTCSTSGKTSKSAEKKAAKTNGFEMQTKKTARPWMLGH